MVLSDDGRPLGLQIAVASAAHANDIEVAFAALRQQNAQAIFVGPYMLALAESIKLVPPSRNSKRALLVTRSWMKRNIRQASSRS